MKKVINGKMYNTATAERIGGYQYSTPDKYDYASEDLYRKHTGEFFLHGAGGPLSDWADVQSNGAFDGCVIKPMTLDEAKQWSEKHLSGDKYVEVFGEVAE